MYTLANLRPTLFVDDTRVSCPVNDCPSFVKRQTRNFKTDLEFLCPGHGIYISPSTFEYSDFRDNLLWTSPEDIALLDRIFLVKRESRMARDNSEDALTWNVFRYLEQSKFLATWLEHVAGSPAQNARVTYWSFDHVANATWPLLAQARSEFGEAPQRGSEPDIIIETDVTLFWIEAKFLARNETIPSDPNDAKKYLTGSDRWFDKVFASPFGKVVVECKLYELSRFWLLGTWAAAKLGKRFCLVNLVRESAEVHIEKAFGSHIKAAHGVFLRATWEAVYRLVLSANGRDVFRDRFLRYMEGKTAGYDGMRKIRAAFDIARV